MNSNLDFYLRCAESSVLGLAGFALATDFMHGAASHHFNTVGVESGRRFPRWFPSVAGCCQLAIVGLNFSGDAGLVLIAQKMLATLMGGAFFVHSTDPPHKSIAAALWFGMSCAVPVIRGNTTPGTITSHAALAGCGWFVGKLVTLSQRKSKRSE